jgi:hypothetical protein
MSVRADFSNARRLARFPLGRISAKPHQHVSFWLVIWVLELIPVYREAPSYVRMSAFF